MQTQINGKPLEFEPRHDETALEVIRGRAGLTGTKLACGGGICGACTVRVDGVPTCSCLMPATQMEGKDVRTIEEYGRANLHPVQRAFMANEGLQCGFCTPGFINEGIAFYDSWRAKHGPKRPSHHEIAVAMGGHLCRCAAYVGIYAAIEQACAGEFDDVTELIAPRVDALAKVTGEAKYTVDVKFPDQLEGKILRSAYPNAIVKSLDFSAAQALEGVVAVADLMEGKTRVRYVGQPIAGVAAIDARTAVAALKLIKVDYEVLPAAISVEQAMAQDAPAVFPDGKDDMPTAAEGASFPYAWDHNVGRVRMGLVTSRRAGTAERRIEEAHNRTPENAVERTYRNAQQVHTALEPHAAVAKWNGSHALHVFASTQGITPLRTEIAEHFDLDTEQVTLESHYIGGGFGGKQGLYREIKAAIILARQANQAVRVVASRLEDIAYTSLRPGIMTETAVTTKADGSPEAIKMHAYGDAGIATGTNPASMYSLMAPRSSYRDLQDYSVLTNTTPGTPFRAPDAPAQRWAIEQAIDEAAYKHDLDPVTMRRKWDPDHEIKNRLLDWVETIPAWQKRGKVNEGNGRFKRGLGLAMAQWLFIYNPNTEIVVSSAPEGVKVSCATQDIGNGTRSSIAQAVVDVMGINRHELILDIGNAARPHGPVAGGSQVTTSVYPTTYAATEQVVVHLTQEATDKMGLKNVKAVQGGVNHAGGFTPWADILAIATPFSASDKRGNERGLLGLRLNVPPGIGMRFGHSAIVTELEVDTRLGKIRPLNVWTGIAVGKIFVRDLANSQMVNGVIQGLGYALYEQKVYDQKTGHTLSSNLNDYRIPGLGDTPAIHIHYDEKGFEEVRAQGIGLSELATIGVAASVGNAMFHATGWRPLSTPITPHDVVTGLKESK